MEELENLAGFLDHVRLVMDTRQRRDEESVSS